MQTLKTAIVVVLLLTVTYSAYVALTAPTPELPAEVASLVEVGTFDLGDIGMGEIDAGTSASVAGEIDAGPSLDPGSPLTGASPAGDATPTAADVASATARISDQYGSPAGDIAAQGPSTAIAPFGAEGAGSPRSLPKPDPSTGAVSADPGQPYPSTPFADFDLSRTGAPATTESTAGEPTIDNVSGTLPSASNPDASAPSAAAPPPGLVNAIATADRQWENDQLREALTTLSLFYNDPGLGEADREPLQARLDMLAGEVIYSSRHLLEQPYRVSQGETLQTIAATYEVPWQLLANINQVQDPAAIVPGQELKIMRGPFRAEINLQRSELTLFLGELYAGRFPVTVGSDPAPQPGTYTVEDKQTARTYYPLVGATIAGGDPRNPYGKVWLDLGEQICIHGSPQTGDGASAGCIRLQTADATDVYGILSEGSAVSIMR